jgi:hypothetical protein
MTRLTTTQVADRLGIGPDAIREYARAGWLTAVTASGRTGKGKRFYFDAEEVDAFAKGGAPAAKAYRERQGGPAKPRRYRRAGA